MKKNLVLPVLLGSLLAVMMLGGCASGTVDKGVFDSSIPDDQQCYLQIQNAMSVKQFDETFVNWSPDGTWIGDKAVTSVTIPAGTHKFNGTYSYQVQYGGVTETKTASFSVDGECLPGHTYKIYQQKIWLIFLTITNVKFKDITPRKVLAELEA
jgi:hypothetical protein